MRWPIACWTIGFSVAVIAGCGGGGASSDGGVAVVAENNAPDSATPTGDPSSMGAPSYADDSMGPGDSSMSDEYPTGPSYETSDPSAPSSAPGLTTMEATYGDGDSSSSPYGDDAGVDDAAMYPDYNGAEGGNPGGADTSAYPEGYAGGQPGYASGPPGASTPGLAPPPGVGGPPTGPSYAPGYAPGADSGSDEYAPGYGGTEGYPGAGGGPGATERRPPPPPKGFDGAAQLAFQAGRDAEAMKYLYAHVLTNDEGAAKLLPTVSWVNGLMRPELAVRFGVGVDFTGSPSITDLKPIGSTQQLPQRPDRRRGATGGDGGYGSPGAPGELGTPGGFGSGGGGRRAAGGHPEVARFAGDFGAQLLSAFTERVERGNFGQVLKDAPGGGAAPARGGAAGGYPAYGAEMSDEAGYAPGGAGAPGGPGVSSAAGVASGSGGLGGAGGAGGYPGASGEGYNPAGYGAAAAAAAGAAGGQSIRPGVTFVGIGSRRELLEKAKEAGVDVLLLLEVTVKQNPRIGTIVNESEATLFDAEKGRRLAGTKTLNNVQVQVKRAEGADDGVQAEVNGLLEYIDENLSMAQLPAVLQDVESGKPHIVQRVAALASGEHDEPMAKLVEIRFWHHRGLLDDATMLAAFSQIVGEDNAKALTTGGEDERKLVVEAWLPGKKPAG